MEVNFPNPGVSVVRGQGQNVRDPPANCAPGGMVTLTSQGKSGQPAPPSIEDISATLENPSDAPKAPASTNVAMAGINLDVDLSAGQAKSAGDNSPGAVDQEVPEGQPEAPKEPQTPVDASENSDAPSIGQPHLETLSADSTSQCNNGGIQCSSDGKSFSICGLSGWISMGGLTPAGIRLDDAFTEFATPGSVAPGTLCRAGAIGLAGPSSLSDETLLSAPCTIGGIKCSEDGKSFYMCHAGTDTYVSMGPVAPGTQCQDGHIVLAGMKRLRKIRRSYLA